MLKRNLSILLVVSWIKRLARNLSYAWFKIPILIRTPIMNWLSSEWRHGHNLRMCRARSNNSPSGADNDAGGSPIWRLPQMCWLGGEHSDGMYGPLASAFIELRLRPSFKASFETLVLALLDCKVPMKCHGMSCFGSYGSTPVSHLYLWTSFSPQFK